MSAFRRHYMKEVVGLENLLEAIFTTAGAGTISAIVRDEFR